MILSPLNPPCACAPRKTAGERERLAPRGAFSGRRTGRSESRSKCAHLTVSHNTLFILLYDTVSRVRTYGRTVLYRTV